MPVVSLTSALTFSEGGVAQYVDPNITISGGDGYTEGYIEFSVSNSTPGDNFTLTSAVNPLANGAISFENGDVFLGTGSARERIGSVDETFNGIDGQPLRILFSSPLPNAGFEEGTENWDIRNEEYGDNGTELNLDALQIALANDNRYTGGTGTTNVQDPNGMSWTGTVQDGQGVDGSRALYLGSDGNIVQGDQVPVGQGTQPDGYGSIHGPYATSSVISVAQGDSISLDFRAVGSGDDYEVFGFLRRVDANGDFISNDVADTADNILLFAQRGRDTSGWINISEEDLPAGDYRFEFVGGTYDASGGYYVGSNLYVDNIRLLSATTVGDNVAQTIARQVTYQNDGDDAPGSRQITVTAVDGNGASGSDSTGLTFVGENDDPGLNTTTLPAIAEDSTPAGQTIGTAFAATFADPDNAYSPNDALAGVVVTGNAATGAQGSWQYSTDGTAWHEIANVDGANGLMLSAATLIRFVPAANWNGTPGALTLHAVDGTYTGGFTDGLDLVTFDTLTNTDETGAVGLTGATAGLVVTAVNDAPVFTSNVVDLELADTAADDAPAALTGTIAASDLHGGAPGEGGAITYGLQGGTLNGGNAVLTDSYGTLTIDRATGAYSFAPDAAALNALAAGEVEERSFTVTASDGQGGVQTQTFTITLTGANDAPLAVTQTGSAFEASGMNNDVAGGAAAGSLLAGPQAAVDVDGDALSVGGVRTGGLSGTGTEGVWQGDVITLEGSFGTLTLDADGSWSYAVDDSNPTVDGLTGPDETLQDTFTYTITDAHGVSSTAELVVEIAGRDDALSVTSSLNTEILTQEDADTQVDLAGLVFADPDLGAELYDLVIETVEGSLWTEVPEGLVLTGNGTGSMVLTGTATAISAWIADNALTYRSAVEGNGADSITLSYGEAGSPTRTLFETIDVAVDMENDPAVVDANGGVLVQGHGSLHEAAILTFRPTGTAQVLNFDGVELSVAAASTAAEIAEAFAALNFPNWTVSHDGEGQVMLTATTPGARPDLTAADFTNGSGAFSPLVVTTGGTDAQVNFTARGPAIAILPVLALSDVDSSTMSGASISMTEGLYDNGFGTIYESLQLSDAALDLAADHGITVSVTTTALTGSVITLAGDASASVYEAILRGVLYSNTNPNAVAGARPVKIDVLDAEGLSSSLATVNLTEGNTDIAVGQRIYINGVDSGQVVSMLRDATSFVASGPLADLEEGATLSFHDGEDIATSAVSAGDGTATVDVHVVWAPVIDMNGPTTAGDTYQTGYVEQQAPIAIATPDARIVDQQGLIRSLDVVLTNPLDNVEGEEAVEYLGMRKSVLDILAARGITLGDHDGQIDEDGNLTGATAITFEAANGASATNFQIALRGVTYANMDDAPEGATRVVTVQGTDMDGNPGLVAETHINPQAVNDAPLAIDSAVTGTEDLGHVFAAEDFGFADTLDGGANALSSIIVTGLPATGQLLLEGAPVTAGTTVTLAQLQSGALSYLPPADANGAEMAQFTFLVQDDGGTANGGLNTATEAAVMVIDIAPANDAPVMAEGIVTTGTTLTEDETGNQGQTVAELLGASSDVDTGAHGADNGTLQGMAIHAADWEGIGRGQWQYQLDGSNDWADISLTDGQVLLLGADDKVRFVPDGANATEARLSYYAWDGATGTAGQVVSGIAGAENAENRGGTSAYSETGGLVTIEVTPENDAPVIGVGLGNTYYARGEAVAMFTSETLVLDDLDDGAMLTQAVVTLDTLSAVDNAFGTDYETIFPEGGATFTAQSGTELAITGTGLAGDPIVITGTGSLDDYREALLSLRYENTNPNLFAGDRMVALSVTDDTGAVSAPSSFVLPVEWATVADLNGPEADGRDHAITYVEGSGGQAIATADAELIDQEGNTVEVVITLEDAVNGSDEQLIVDPSVLDALADLDITITGNGSHEIRLSNDGGLDPTHFQLALRAIRYVNLSTAPTDAARHVTVNSTDADGNPGVPATTVIGVEKVNDAPESTVAILYEAMEHRNPLSGDMLILSGMLDDADGISEDSEAMIEWLRDGQVIDMPEASPFYTLTEADAGHVISARITYTDGEGTFEEVIVAGTDLVGLNLPGTDGADLLTGSIAADSLSGGLFDDTLTGGAGEDSLLGGDGADSIYGNQGQDLIEGGEGNDWLHGGQGSDVVLGDAGDDTLAGGLGDDLLDGGEGRDTASYDTATSAVVVNLGLQGFLQYVSHQEGLDTLNSIENLTGSSHDDVLIGDDLVNVLTGGAGHDTLIGNGGEDTLIGGAGQDVLNAGEGMDSLLGNEGDDTLSAGDGNDWLHGGQGNDVVLGDAGDDTLAGGLGDDTVAGGEGFDTADYTTATAGVTVDLALQDAPQWVNAEEGWDYLSQIESLAGSAHADNLSGDAGSNALDGAAGDDRIMGRGGDDLVVGGEGTDSLYGNQGDDVVIGGLGNDWLHGGQGSDVVVGAEGDDILTGGIGNDTVVGGDGIDTADFQTAAAGVSVDLMLQNTIQFINAEEGSDLLSEIENLTGSNHGDHLSGDAGANALTGLAGDDQIEGRHGDDLILGGGGADMLLGNQGDDVLDGGMGDDWLHGGQGADMLEGGLGDDLLAGGRGADVLTGGAGADVFQFQYADGTGGIDQITDFEQGSDLIALADDLLLALAQAGGDLTDRVVWDAGTGILGIDLGFPGLDLVVDIARIEHDGSLNLTADDFLTLIG